MGSAFSSGGYDRVVERRRAVALAHHYREVEGLSNAEIARHLGRSPATIKSYFYDPTGDKARAVKARYVGVCRGCGAYTQPRNGKGDAYAYCKACHRRSSGAGPGSGCLRRCGSGAIGMSGFRPRTTGRARMHGGEGGKRCAGWRAATGRPRAW